MAKNAEKPWTQKDINKCAKLHNDGWFICYIAEQLERTPFAIKCRLDQLCLEPHSVDDYITSKPADIGAAAEEQLAGSRAFFHIPELNEENITMKTLETITFVRGKNVNECSHEDVIQAIRETKASINDLVSVHAIANSPKMVEQIAELENDILELAKIYDNI